MFSGIDRDSLVDLPDISPFIDSLVSQGRLDEAEALWLASSVESTGVRGIPCQVYGTEALSRILTGTLPI